MQRRRRSPCAQTAVALAVLLCSTGRALAHRDHAGKIKQGKVDEPCDWNNDSEDCDDGLTCWKGVCKDRDPPMIHLTFPKGMSAPKPFQLPPKVELKFPGTSKTVDCNDVVEECEGPSHPACVAAKAGKNDFWAQNCRKSCGLCAIEEQVEKQYDNWDQQEQAAPQQPAQTVAQRRAQLEQQLHQLQAQQQGAGTRQSFRGNAAKAQQWPSGAAEDEEAAQPRAQGGGQAGQAQAAGAGNGSDVLTFSLVAIVVLVAFGFKAHASAVPGQSNFGGAGDDATGSSSSSSYNPVPGI